MSDSSDLIITISGNAESLVDAMKDVGEETEKMDGLLRAALGGAAAGFALLIAAVGEGVVAFGKQEQASNSLALALQNQGIYSDELLASYKEQAEAIEKNTGVSADAVVQGQATLQSMIGQLQITPQLTKAIVDFSAGARIGLSEAFNIVGKAIDGNTSMLKRHNITLEDTGTRAGNLQEIIEKLGQKFDGQAESAAKGVGAVKLLEGAFERLSKTIGEAFAPAVSAAAIGFAHFVDATTTWIRNGQPTLEQLDATADKLRARILSLEDAVKGYNANGNFGSARDATAELLSLHRQLGQTTIAIESLTAAGQKEVDAATKQNAEKKRLADIEAANVAASYARKADIREAANDLQILQDENASKEQIELKQKELKLLEDLDKDHTAKERAIIQDRIDQLAVLQENADKDAAAKEDAFNKTILAKDQAFQKLNEKEQADFLAKHGKALKASIKTEEDVRLDAANKEAEQNIAAQNQYLADFEKYGEAYATINEAIHSQVFTQTAGAFSQLAELQSSSNSTLKAIGKAGAQVQIAIHTAQAAMDIYAGFQALPPWIGIPLGIAGAAAAVAFGAEQEANVTAAAEGGLMTGGIPGKDSIPTLTMPGELVVPTQNFDEVVTATANQRSGGSSQQQPYAQIDLNLTGDFGKVVEASIVKNQRLGISILKKVT